MEKGDTSFLENDEWVSKAEQGTLFASEGPLGLNPSNPQISSHAHCYPVLRGRGQPKWPCYPLNHCLFAAVAAGQVMWNPAINPDADFKKTLLPKITTNLHGQEFHCMWHSMFRPTNHTLQVCVGGAGSLT